jgi:hypothetical protein
VCVVYYSLCGRNSNKLATVVTELQAEGSGVLVPAGSRELRLPQKVWTGSGAHPASYQMDIGSSSCGQNSRSWSCLPDILPHYLALFLEYNPNHRNLLRVVRRKLGRMEFIPDTHFKDLFVSTAL